MNGNRPNLTEIHAQSVDNATKLALVQQSVSNLQGDLQKLANTVTNFIQNSQDSQRPNWSVWIAAASLVILMCSGGWMVLTLKINAEIHPMVEKMVAMEAIAEGLQKIASSNAEKVSAIAVTSQASSDDRLTINKNLDLLRDKVTEMLAEQSRERAERVTKEIEIETQFDAASQLQNVQFSDQQRVNRMLWNQHTKQLGEYPSAPFFFPNISSRNGKTAGAGH